MKNYNNYYNNHLHACVFIMACTILKLFCIEMDCLTMLIEKLKPRNSKVSSDERLSHFLCVGEVSIAVYAIC